MTAFSVAGLIFLLVAAPVLICSAHIPGLREITGAAPLEDEPAAEPYTAVTERDESFLAGDFAEPDRTYRTIQARRAAGTDDTTSRGNSL